MSAVINGIKVRYYFLDNSSNRDATPGIVSATWHSAGTSSDTNLVNGPGCSIAATFSTAPMQSYVEFGCNQTSSLGGLDSVEITVAINPSTQIPSDDYSYLAATGGGFVANDHLVLLYNGAIIKGTPPP
jgi:hypothetical protein